MVEGTRMMSQDEESGLGMGRNRKEKSARGLRWRVEQERGEEARKSKWERTSDK